MTKEQSGRVLTDRVLSPPATEPEVSAHSGDARSREMLDRARRLAAEAAIAEATARGVGFYPGKVMAAYLAGQFDRSAAVQRRLCVRCNGTGTVHGIIDDDLLISGSWPCERGCGQ